MSIYGALFSGVSGLSAQAQAMGMLSDNITNVNTVGYKETTARFSSLVTSSATATAYAPGGVRSTPQQLIDKQGLLTSSVSPTDLAINGNGFMVVTDTATPSSDSREFLTRAGSFTTDVNGNLKNAGGYFLRGYGITQSGTTDTTATTLSTVNVANFAPTLRVTSVVGMQANLKASQAVSSQAATYVGGTSATNMASGNVTPDFSRSVEIYDSLGTPRTLTFAFLKHATLANTWNTEIYVSPSSVTTGVTSGQVMRGTLAFNTDGTWKQSGTSFVTGAGAAITPSSGDWSTAIPFDTTTLGIAAQTVRFDFGTDAQANGMTQYDGDSTLVSTNVDGARVGQLSAISINENGILTAIFENGITLNKYRLPVGMVPNPNGLAARSGNVFQQTSTSGSLTKRNAGTNGAGLYAPSSLESSTVDLANEFSKMIMAQRAFSASAKIITTADEMLDELLRTKR